MTDPTCRDMRRAALLYVSAELQLAQLGHSTEVKTSAPLPVGFTVGRFPSLLKEVDVNKRTGIIESYLTCYFNDDGTPFIDPYDDIIEPGSFTKTIRTLDDARRSKNNP